MHEALEQSALDHMIAATARRAHQHSIEITFEFEGRSYTVKPVKQVVPYWDGLTDLKPKATTDGR